jgi:hypothetical protein
MRALVRHGKDDFRCDNAPDPRIEAPRDAIVKVTRCASLTGPGRSVYGTVLSAWTGEAWNIPTRTSADIAPTSTPPSATTSATSRRRRDQPSQSAEAARRRTRPMMIVQSMPMAENPIAVAGLSRSCNPRRR